MPQAKNRTDWQTIPFVLQDGREKSVVDAMVMNASSESAGCKKICAGAEDAVEFIEGWTVYITYPSLGFHP